MSRSKSFNEEINFLQHVVLWIYQTLCIATESMTFSSKAKEFFAVFAKSLLGKNAFIVSNI